ncbi:hypothetical protein, partial [Roseinatronobacter alkalisoli]
KPGGLPQTLRNASIYEYLADTLITNIEQPGDFRTEVTGADQRTDFVGCCPAIADHLVSWLSLHIASLYI